MFGYDIRTIYDDSRLVFQCFGECANLVVVLRQIKRKGELLDLMREVLRVEIPF